MTSPLQGYPDYARRTPMADQILINDTQTGLMSLITYTVGYVPNILALWMHFTAQGGRSRVQFSWYADSGFTVLIGQAQMDTGSTSGIINRSFRTFAPYLKVTVIPQAGSSLNTTLILTTVSDVTIPTLSNVYVNDIGRNGTSIGATSSDTAVSQQCRIGSALWSVTASAASWNARLQTVDFNNNISTIDRVDNANGAGQQRPIYIGGGTPQILVVNNDASAKVYNAFLNWVPDISK